jgi:hypothetical protein
MKLVGNWQSKVQTKIFKKLARVAFKGREENRIRLKSKAFLALLH